MSLKVIILLALFYFIECERVKRVIGGIPMNYGKYDAYSIPFKFIV